ncbi:MAG TPA: hypothetical protein VN516_10070 [Candidatus Baltobacteraceae bacterium]|nr:hypothetical protein [Candidatus Baltobacteraceae bacterium]
MPQVGLKEAARLTGKNQSTIHRAMKTNKLSFKLNENGERVVDVAELDRVFPVNPQGKPARNDNDDLQAHVDELARLRLQLEAERAGSSVAKERLEEKDAVIADLREDRDKWRNQAEKLLITDQRAHKSKRHSWWSFGKKA